MIDTHIETIGLNEGSIRYRSGHRLGERERRLLQQVLSRRFGAAYSVAADSLVGDWSYLGTSLAGAALGLIALFHAADEDGGKFIFYRARLRFDNKYAEAAGPDGEWVHVPHREAQSLLSRSRTWLTDLDRTKLEAITSYVESVVTDPGVWEPLTPGEWLERGDCRGDGRLSAQPGRRALKIDGRTGPLSGASDRPAGHALSAGR
jgi:hypothetical protein